ncbi:MAG: SH3 domain-containing protein [Propionibacteriaceae bacterium]
MIDLGELVAAQVFDARPVRPGLGLLHVPFDELTGTATAEAVLVREMRDGGRAAVTGRSGMGKSSMITYCLDQLADAVADLRIPVAAEADELVRDVGRFAAHMIALLLRQAQTAQSMSAEDRSRAVAAVAAPVTRERRERHHYGVGLPRWLLVGDAAAEVESVLTVRAEPSTSEIIGTLQHLLAVVSGRGGQPVIVLDDSDAWLETPVGDRTSLIGPFFAHVLPTLVSEVGGGWMVAVHDHYLERADFPRDTGALTTAVAVPALPDQAALTRILAERVSGSLVEPDPAAVAVVLTEPALAAIWDRYLGSDGNIRLPLQLAHTALQVAWEEDATEVSLTHVQVAATRFPFGEGPAHR